jgi:hypothetical protein
VSERAFDEALDRLLPEEAESSELVTKVFRGEGRTPDRKGTHDEQQEK